MNDLSPEQQAQVQAAQAALDRKRAAWAATLPTTPKNAVDSSMPSPPKLSEQPCVGCQGAVLAEPWRKPEEVWCYPCAEGRRTQELSTQRAYRREHLVELMREAGIPSTFCRLDWQFREALRPYVVNQRGVCLSGLSGRGKTVDMCLLARESMQHAIDTDQPLPGWRFVSFPKLVMQLQDAWRREMTEETAYQRLEVLARAERLILDDLGAEKLTEFVRHATYFLINEREQWGGVTYLTTNFTLRELDQQFDSRISSRIAGMCDVMVVKGEDRRIAKR